MVHISSGSRLIFFYILSAYLIPACLVGILGYPWIYREFDLNYCGLGVLLLVFIVYFYLGNFSVIKDAPQKIIHSANFVFLLRKKNILIYLLIVSVIIAASGAVFQLNGFRYSDTGISESPLLWLTILLALVPSFLQFFLMVYIFYSSTGGGMVERLLLALGLLLSSNGIATLLIAMLAVMHLLFPQTLKRILFKEPIFFRKRNNHIFHEIIEALCFLLISVVLMAVAWIAGEGIKRGELSTVIDLVFSDQLLPFAQEWIVLRVSPSYISLLAALDEYSLNTQWNVLEDHFFAPMGSFLFRLNTLSVNMLDFQRPLNGSIARVNYLLITDPEFVRDREGTSPGLVASFLYCFPFPLNFFVLTFYLFFLQRFSSRLIDGINRKMSFIGWCVFLIFMLPMFVSPVDFLLIIDDGAISALLLVLLSFVFLQKESRR